MMLSWFKRRPKLTTAERLTKAIPRVLDAYGALMERYPTAILDTSKLPLPKTDMKFILKIAWLLESDDKGKNVMEFGYLHLAQFQDGVGDKPIDPTLPANFDPTKVIAVLDPYLPFSAKMAKETVALMEELQDFKLRGALS